MKCEQFFNLIFFKDYLNNLFPMHNLFQKYNQTHLIFIFLFEYILSKDFQKLNLNR